MVRTAHVVFRGRIPGVYDYWLGPDQAQQQVDGFSNNYHRGYDSREEAEAAWNQWLKNHPHVTNPSYARESLSTSAEIDRQHLFGVGAFKNVYRGNYTNGPRQGQPCVTKEFISGGVYEDSYFANELKVVKKALDLVIRFNDGNFVNRKIYVNEPLIWVYERDAIGVAGQKHLTEPMIENFEKFNSNTGWTPKYLEGWAKVMQALSHFSYHISGRDHFLCDIQGGIYRDGFVLSDPVIMSVAKSFGPTDLGLDGISTFFARHRCNEFCKPHWSRPHVQVEIFNRQQGSAMLLSSQTSRQPLSKGIAQRIRGMTIEE